MPRKPIIRVVARSSTLRIAIDADPKRVSPETYAQFDEFASRVQQLMADFFGGRKLPRVPRRRGGRT